MSCMVSPDPDKDKDKKDKQYCEICAEAGFKKEAIRWVLRNTNCAIY
ncbi:MAG: hypothetical protein WBQ25_07115 [Nitrososphaeraceae archaeon]